MRQQTTRISPEDISRQLQYCREVAALSAARPAQPLAFVDTYGCQQNEADSERIRGYLAQMGFGFTSDEERARVIVINTCAIREHAEQRVFGNLGALVHTKRRHPEQIICLCGCMAQEPHVADRIRQSYRHVDLVFGPHELWRFPEFIHTLMTQKGRIFQIADQAGSIAEGSLAPAPIQEGPSVRPFPHLTEVERPRQERAPRRLPRLSLDGWASVAVLVMTLTFTLRVLVF